MKTIDLNSDLGEGAGTDEALMPLISSVNVACGAHAGDAETMRVTVDLALRHHVAVGAHPGYPDRERFGRVALDMRPEQIAESVRAQVESLMALARERGAAVSHVKAHGALYNRAEREADVARDILRGIRAADPNTTLVVFAPPRSAMWREAVSLDVPVAREGYVDRTYELDGTLRSRRLAGALVTDPARAAAQALGFVREGGVRAHDGAFLALDVDTLCIHGDTPGAPAIAAAVREALAAAGVAVAPFRIAR